MAKLFSIVMSCLVLVQGFEIAYNDIAQFDEFLEHASFHAEEYGDNLFVFVSKHYGELKEQHDKDHQEEQKEHEKLPFQNQCHCGAIVAIVFNTTTTELNSPKTTDGSLANFHYMPSTSSLHAKGLLQPPQSV